MSGMEAFTCQRFPAQSTLNLPISSLLTLLKQKSISGLPVQSNPHYTVWEGSRQSDYINSLFENFVQCPIIFGTNGPLETLKHNNLTVSLHCIDGRQRISAIRAFILGAVPCHDEKSQCWYYRSQADEKKGSTSPRRVFDSSQRAAFLATTLHVVQSDFTKAEVAEVQFRLQHSRSSQRPFHLDSLRFQCSDGDWLAVIEDFKTDFSSLLSLLGPHFTWQQEVLAVAFIQMLEVKQGNPGKPHVLYCTKDQCRNYFPCSEATLKSSRRYLAQAFNILKRLAEANKDVFCHLDVPRKINNRNSNNRDLASTLEPVELIAVLVLIAKVYRDINNEQILESCQTLLYRIRSVCLQLRLNQDTWDVIWEWIAEPHLLLKPETLPSPVIPIATEPPAQPQNALQQSNLVVRLQVPPQELHKLVERSKLVILKLPLEKRKATVHEEEDSRLTKQPRLEMSTQQTSAATTSTPEDPMLIPEKTIDAVRGRELSEANSASSQQETTSTQRPTPEVGKQSSTAPVKIASTQTPRSSVPLKSMSPSVRIQQSPSLQARSTALNDGRPKPLGGEELVQRLLANRARELKADGVVSKDRPLVVPNSGPPDPPAITGVVSAEDATSHSPSFHVSSGREIGELEALQQGQVEKLNGNLIPQDRQLPASALDDEDEVDDEYSEPGDSDELDDDSTSTLSDQLSSESESEHEVNQKSPVSPAPDPSKTKLHAVERAKAWACAHEGRP